MTEKYYTILTNTGLRKEALANSDKSLKINLTQMAIGDCNGQDYDPKPEENSLQNEVYRTNLTHVEIDNDNPYQLIIEALINEEEGPFYIREVGIYDADGDLFAIGKYPETFKPALVSGSGKRLYIRMILGFSNSPNINLIISRDINTDPNFSENINNNLATKLTKSANLADLTDINKAHINLKLGIGALANNASETEEGIAKIATQEKVNQGENDTDFISPLKLKTLMDSNSINGIIGRKVFTASGIWNKPANCNKVIVELVGGGGAGGTTGQHGGGGGGAGAGGYSYKKITSGLEEFENIVVGLGGIGYDSKSGKGNDGSASSFGSHFLATGGIGGNGYNNTKTGGAGGIGKNGDINFTGGNGGDGGAKDNAAGIDGTTVGGYNGTPGALGNGGKGGVSSWPNAGGGAGGGGGIFGGFLGFAINGSGGNGGNGQNNGTGENGFPGSDYGGGGGGGSSSDGGNGAPGIVIVWEYS